MRIRWRLALYGAGVTIVAVLVFGVVLSLLASGAAPADQQKELAALAERAVAGLAGVDAAGLAARDPLILVDATASTDAFLVVVAPDGEVLHATGTVGGAPVRVPAAVVVEALDTGESTAVVQAGGGLELRLHARRWEPAGVVVAAQSTEFAEEQVSGFVAVLWVSGIVTLLVAVAVAWLVSGRAMRPLRRLAATTEEIAQTGDLSRRLPEVRARDEVGALTAGFNAMLDRVEEAQARLASALAAQRRFVADASHELRGPLTTIRNNAGLLTGRRPVTDDDRAEAVAEIAAEADRMAGLVDDLLTLARADTGRSYDLRPVDLAGIVYDAVRRPPGPAPVVGPVARAEVAGDPEALERLVAILLDNAVKHGGGEVEIGVTVDGGLARLTVVDRGPGIPPADLERVFERFYRADPARSPAGTGLGLAIAAGVAAGHGGRISAANRPSGGAAITVELPLAG